jgi:putative hydrolase of the HAD superfamily
MIEAVTFDFWNTLFTAPREVFEHYLERRVERLHRAVGDRHGVARERCEELLRDDLSAFGRIWRDELRTPTTRERVDCLVDMLGVGLDEGELEAIALDFEEHLLDRPPVPVEGAREVVAELGARFPLAVISDTGYTPGRVLRRVIEAAEMLGHFRYFAFSNEVGRSKPHPEVFDRAAEALGAAPHGVLHVGDLEATDVAGAKDAGFVAVRFTGCTPLGEGEATRADYVIRDLRELPALIASIDEA